MIEVFGLKCLRVKTLKDCMYLLAEIRRVLEGASGVAALVAALSQVVAAYVGWSTG